MSRRSVTPVVKYTHVATCPLFLLPPGTILTKRHREEETGTRSGKDMLEMLSFAMQKFKNKTDDGSTVSNKMAQTIKLACSRMLNFDNKTLRTTREELEELWESSTDSSEDDSSEDDEMTEEQFEEMEKKSMAMLAENVMEDLSAVLKTFAPIYKSWGYNMVNGVGGAHTNYEQDMHRLQNGGYRPLCETTDVVMRNLAKANDHNVWLQAEKPSWNLNDENVLFNNDDDATPTEMCLEIQTLLNNFLETQHPLTNEQLKEMMTS